jgi:hypothetical protein
METALLALPLILLSWATIFMLFERAQMLATREGLRLEQLRLDAERAPFIEEARREADAIGWAASAIAAPVSKPKPRLGGITTAEAMAMFSNTFQHMKFRKDVFSRACQCGKCGGRSALHRELISKPGAVIEVQQITEVYRCFSRPEPRPVRTTRGG